MSTTELSRLKPQGAGHEPKPGAEAVGALSQSHERALSAAFLETDTPIVSWACTACGRMARVQILHGYAAEEPIVRHYCLSCARNAPMWIDEFGAERSRLRLSILLGLAGSALAAFALLADWLIPARMTAGFGWHKECGLALGALLVLIGTLARADIVAWGGALVFGGSLTAGLIGFSHNSGFGWKQQALLAISATCVGVAVLARVGVLRAMLNALRKLRANASCKVQA